MGYSQVQQSEEFVEKLFSLSGYEITRSMSTRDEGYDLCAISNNDIYAIEVKYYSSTQPARTFERVIAYTESLAKASTMKWILIFFCIIPEEKISEYKERYPDIIVMDVHHLLFISENDDSVYNELLALLPFNADGVNPLPSPIELSWLSHGNYIEGLKKQLDSCELGRKHFIEYEKTCFEVLKALFSNDLTLWKEQPKANDGLFRFDLICRIKNGVENSFWNIIEQYLNTKYVVFEFKNYSKAITQDQVITTEKYLYTKALRMVAIIISSQGADDNALKCAKGIYRDSGKLIFLLDTIDLKNMCDIKKNEEEPSEYLLEKLDTLLLELEK